MLDNQSKIRLFNLYLLNQFHYLHLSLLHANTPYWNNMPSRLPMKWNHLKYMSSRMIRFNPDVRILTACPCPRSVPNVNCGKKSIMTKGNNKKSNRVLREFCIRLFIFSCKICLRALDSYNRILFWYMEHQKKMNLAIDFLGFLWDLCNNLFA